MKKETQQKIVKGVKELVGLVGDVAEEIQTDVKTKTGKALGMYTRDEVVSRLAQYEYEKRDGTLKKSPVVTAKEHIAAASNWLKGYDKNHK